MFRFLGSLLNSIWSDYFKKVFGLYGTDGKTLLADNAIVDSTGNVICSDKAAGEAWLAASNALGVVELVLWIALAVVGVAGIIYSIWLGIQLARAEEQGKRDDAKKHLITVVIAIGVTLVLVVFFNTILPLILSAVRG